VYFSIIGFMSGYLWTRVLLAPLFKIADKGVLGALREARASLVDAEQKTRLADQILEESRLLRDAQDEILRLLYSSEDQAFRKAIDVGQRYIGKVGAPKDAMFWIRMACAYGQQYAWENAHSAEVDAPQHEATKASAFGAIDRALEVNPTEAIFYVRYLSDPHFPGKPVGEDDLEVFYGTAELMARLPASE